MLNNPIDHRSGGRREQRGTWEGGKRRSRCVSSQKIFSRERAPARLFLVAQLRGALQSHMRSLRRKCGGEPRNSFVAIKLSPVAIDKEDRPFCDRVMLLQTTDSVPTPSLGAKTRALTTSGNASTPRWPRGCRCTAWPIIWATARSTPRWSTCAARKETCSGLWTRLLGYRAVGG